MRAICGAIIAAGSLVGLGLLSMGIGSRYQLISQHEIEYVKLKDLDTALLLILVFLIISALIGLGIAFVGLAYHHHRRYHEHLHGLQPNNTGGPRVTV
jgi:formate hydrogenlyase subunit 3/multisubunit Na+/H+ antiporter MnhD subunit